MSRKIILHTPEEASELVVLASQCDFDVDISCSRNIKIDAKSILGVLSLDFDRQLTVEYSGSSASLEKFLEQHAAVSVVA